MTGAVHLGIDLGGTKIEIAALDAQGAFRAQRGSFGRHAARLACALAQVINLLDPDVIVLGGGMSNVAEVYDAVPRLWEPHVFSDGVRTAPRPACGARPGWRRHRMRPLHDRTTVGAAMPPGG